MKVFDAGPDGKTAVYCRKEKAFPAGHSCGDGNLEKKRIIEYVSFRTLLMPRRNAILGVAGVIIWCFFPTRRTAESFVFPSTPHTRPCRGVRQWELIQMRSFHTSPARPKFPAHHARSAGLFQSVRGSSRGCQATLSSFPRVSHPAEEPLTAPSS